MPATSLLQNEPFYSELGRAKVLPTVITTTEGAVSFSRRWRREREERQRRQQSAVCQNHPDQSFSYNEPENICLVRKQKKGKNAHVVDPDLFLKLSRICHQIVKVIKLSLFNISQWEILAIIGSLQNPDFIQIFGQKILIFYNFGVIFNFSCPKGTKI